MSIFSVGMRDQNRNLHKLRLGLESKPDTRSKSIVRQIGIESKIGIRIKHGIAIGITIFLKSKIDYTETPIYGSPESGSSSNSPTNSTSSSIQPPLPLHPPPLDSPTEDRTSDVDIKDPLLRTEIVSKTEKPDEPEDYEVLEETISIKVEPQKPDPCRDFIRGTCTRPDCKYLHEYDLSHLYRVYTFCRNYQNSICTLPNCRYAHATVFEEQAFYRTGILPPHALAHHKNNNNNNSTNIVPNPINKSFILQPPPPPPPPPGLTTSGPPTATVPAPVPVPVPVSVAEPEESSQHLNLNITPAALQIGLQYTKEKVDNMTKSALEFDEKLIELEKKSTRLLACILSVVKPLNTRVEWKAKINEDAELEEDSSQTQKEFALSLEVTQQAVSRRLKS
ncbi:Zinc finger CCCH domain-containing protein 10 [Eumeta japonica]|uniref:Zinc finger CCCH domain-containing protein 10 n=1 Tax=Eumeta variegata TaxID=151549 RepID=A0A4C1XS37_EUMVA|nr:Zinc finger CCCH domain-containing protein 10 [Eumeta japonica]